MRQLKNMVVVEETIGSGVLNDKGKAIVSTTKKRYSRSKEWATKAEAEDETIKIVGDAYEVYKVVKGQKVRLILTKEEAEKIEGVAPETEEEEVKKRGRKPKVETEIE